MQVPKSKEVEVCDFVEKPFECKVSEVVCREFHAPKKEKKEVEERKDSYASAPEDGPVPV